MSACPMLTELSVTSPDLEALHDLNNQLAKELSLIDVAHFRWLIEHAFFAAEINGTEAFVIAFDQDAPYKSQNFLWFKKRFLKFVYVDRLATAAFARGRGHALALYDTLFARARAAGHTLVVCEINEDPPNPISVGLHARFGFIKVGDAVLPEANKTVGYFVKNI